jgi:hypothetical protein
VADARLRPYVAADWFIASRSFTKAARLYGIEGDAKRKAEMLEYAQRIREYAEGAQRQGGGGGGSGAHVAPIMAAREAAANAAMEALLAEEEKEKAAASSKAGTSKRNKGRK